MATIQQQPATCTVHRKPFAYKWVWFIRVLEISLPFDRQPKHKIPPEPFRKEPTSFCNSWVEKMEKNNFSLSTIKSDCSLLHLLVHHILREVPYKESAIYHLYILSCPTQRVS